MLSINSQILKPVEIIIVDNNTSQNESNALRSLIENANISEDIKIIILDSPKNSGAIARNIGVKNSNTDIVAFLDSDVILDKDYYSILIKYLYKDENILAIQGDKSLVDSQKEFKNKNMLFKLFNSFEEFLRHHLYITNEMHLYLLH